MDDVEVGFQIIKCFYNLSIKGEFFIITLRLGRLVVITLACCAKHPSTLRAKVAKLTANE